MERTLMQQFRKFRLCRFYWLLLLFVLAPSTASAGDLPEILEEGTLRHLGIPYANFVTGSGDGLDIEVVQMFAEHLGVDYEYVRSDWTSVFGDLTGRHARAAGDHAEWLNATEKRGDLIANGLTILPWRKEIVEFSSPTFPSGVWLIARADSKLSPILPSGNVTEDITQVKHLIDGRTVLSFPNTCLDPEANGLFQTGADVRHLAKITNLNEMVPAILNDDAETTLLDVPDALIALEKWPGQIKVIGPISGLQEMAVAFPKDSPKLREAFNSFFTKIKADGTYLRLVQHYYPSAMGYYSDYFAAM